jgi:hypothetical protein
MPDLIPAKTGSSTGIQNALNLPDSSRTRSGICRNDGKTEEFTFYDFINPSTFIKSCRNFPASSIWAMK